MLVIFFFSSRRRHTRSYGDWSSDVCSSDLFLPEKNQWPRELADPGLSDWETPRCLRRGIIDQFLQWTVCAMAAPRRLVYSYELGWNVEDLPAWARYKKVFDLYHAPDHLAEAHGFGPFPGPGECWHIGPAQRRSLYPTLDRKSVV